MVCQVLLQWEKRKRNIGQLADLSYADIGELLESSGAVPVVIKSLIFPASAALGQEWKAKEPATA